MKTSTHQRINLADGVKANQKVSHIAFVSNRCTSIYQFRKGIVLALMDAGFEVTCIVPEDSFTNHLLAEGIKLELIDLEGYTRNPLQEYRYYKQLKACYARLCPDVIFHYTIKPNIWGSFAASALGIPSVMVVTGLGNFPDISNLFIRKITGFLYKNAVKRADQVWFLNHHDEGFFEGHGWLDKVKIKVLPSEGVDTRYFSYEPIPTTDGRLKVLFAGRLIRKKGVYEFAAAAKTLHDQGENVDCSMLGFLERKNPDAVELSDLEEWCNEGYITYLGETHDVRPYLAACDVVVLPTTYREGVSRILLEAMAMGRPIITTKNVGCEELVEHLKNGLLIPKNSSKAIVDALLHVAELPYAQRVQMGKAGRNMVLGKYEESIVIREYFKYIQTLQKSLPQAKALT